MPKNTSVRDSFEISEQQIPDTRSGNREGAVTKFESGWLLDKAVVAGRAVWAPEKYLGLYTTRAVIRQSTTHQSLRV